MFTFYVTPMQWPQPVPDVDRSPVTRRFAAAQVVRARHGYLPRRAGSRPIPLGAAEKADLRWNCRTLARQGWRPKDYANLLDKAARYLLVQVTQGVYDNAEQTATSRWFTAPGAHLPGPGLTQLRANVTTVLDEWAEELPLPVAYGWLTTFLTIGYQDDTRMPWWASVDRLILPDRWACLGDLGPLAWGAGLSLDAALAQQAAGQLSDITLRAKTELHANPQPRPRPATSAANGC